MRLVYAAVLALALAFSAHVVLADGPSCIGQAGQPHIADFTVSAHAVANSSAVRVVGEIHNNGPVAGRVDLEITGRGAEDQVVGSTLFISRVMQPGDSVPFDQWLDTIETAANFDTRITSAY